MKTTIWIINGWTSNIGSWELEIFTSEEEAQKMFDYYIDEYEATCDDGTIATCDDGTGWFSIEERELTFND